MRVVFFGTPWIAAEVLEYLLQQKVQVVAVISKPDKAQGRSATPQPVPVKLVAEKYKLPIYQPEKVSAEEFLPTLQALKADLFVVVAYGEILKQHVLDCPTMACLNLHASLLPKYRGAAPIQRAIINGERETGVTIMHMVRKMDAGEILLQVKTAITPEMTAGELQNELSHIGKKALLQIIQQFATGTPPTATPQDESQATMAPKIELEDCQIHWNQPAETLHNLIRGVNPEPGAWCTVQIATQTKRLKIFSSRLHPEIALPQGELLLDKHLLVGTSQGALELLEVQLEGKKRLPAVDFYRGIPKGILSLL